MSREPLSAPVGASSAAQTGWIAEIRPDVHAKGTDYAADAVPERSVVAAYGGKTVIVGDPKDHGTTDVIERIRRG